jgi:hypothetical protein
MLIQETHKDVPTKAGGKEGTMRDYFHYILSSMDCIADPFRHFPVPPDHSGLPKGVCKNLESRTLHLLSSKQTLPRSCGIQ